MKKLFSILLVFTLIFSAGAAVTFAEEDIYADLGDVELGADAGLTPNSPLYFIDSLFETSDDPSTVLDYKDEKIAEAEQMIEDGHEDAAKEALEKAGEYNEFLEKEITPDLAPRATASSKAVTELLENLDEDIQGEKWLGVRELVDEQKKSQKNIASAAQLAEQIKNLCTSLADLDFELYSNTCKTGEDSPNWQQDLDKELTAEQAEEAKNFHGIITSCFATDGKNCRCDDIQSPEFAKACTEASGMAVSCEAGDESACTKLETFNMPELPPYLQGVFDDVEGEFSEAKFEKHTPKECEGVEASECGKQMVMKHADPLCQEAFATMYFETEDQMWDFCAELLENSHMDSEHPICAENGLGAEECKDFLWNLDYRDPVCQSHEIHDYYSCQEFLGEGGTEKVEDGEGGKGVDTRCTEITDTMKRLECYDNAANGIWQEIEENLPDDLPEICLKKHAYTKEACDETVAGWEMEQNKCEDCDAKCPGNVKTNCVDNQCMCYYSDGSSGRPGSSAGSSASSGGDDDDSGSGYDSEDSSTWSECKDGCQQECPGQNTDCVDDVCVCLGTGYDDSDDDNVGSFSEGSSSSGSDESTEPASSTDSSSDEVSESESIESDGGGSGSNDNSGGGGGAGELSEITGESIRNRFVDYY